MMSYVAGNEFMKQEKYAEALVCYTSAVEKDSENAVYYCNRYECHFYFLSRQSGLIRVFILRMQEVIFCYRFHLQAKYRFL